MAQAGDDMRKRKRAGEMAVMEIGRILTTKAMEITSSVDSFKRRKLAANDSHTQLISHRDDENSPETSVTSDRDSLSRCSSNDVLVKGELRSVDLKVESRADGFETEISTLINCKFRRETTPSSELCEETDELDSSTAKKPSPTTLRRKNPEAKMPPAAEIEEFFSAAEKYEQKRFANKYNYDIEKDVPLEGRYQWIPLKP